MHQNKTTVVHKTDREERLNFVTSHIHEMWIKNFCHSIFFKGKHFYKMSK